MPNKRKNHGLHALMGRVKAHGIQALDGRSMAVRAAKAWRTALLNDLGGESNVSTQRLAIVDLAARTKLCLDMIDAWLMSQDSLVNKRRKALIPAVKERQVLADSLARLLGQIGLQRQARPVAAIPQHVVQPHDWEEQEEEVGGDSPVEEPTAKDAKRSEDANEKPE
jgi:hypothetical protein